MRLSSSRTTALTHRPQQDFPLWDLAGSRPSLDLQFADSKSLVDATTGQNLVTFTRASSGTYVGSDGLIKTATTNLLLQSNQFDTTWTNTNSSETAAAGIAPDGTNTAWELKDTVDGSAVTHALTQSSTIVSGVTYTYSVFMKAGTLGFGAIAFPSAGFTTAVLANFNLNTGASSVNTGTATASAVLVGNGWYRCSVTATATASVSTGLGFRVVNGISAGTYQGDGTGTILIWGAQLEQSSTVGEYIPTTSTINSAPRFDHNPTTGESLGLLVEESRTNLLLQSENFSTTWTQSNVTVTANTVTAPDGTTTADTFGPVVGDGLTTTRFLRQNPALTTQQAYTLSVFVKVGTATTNGIALYVSDQTATNIFRGNFNLFTLGTTAGSTGWATPTSTIIPYPNGWYRCILSGVTSTAHTALRAQIYLNGFVNTADTYGTIHIWGAQLEAGAFPTSYIPTTTATVTRSADVASITGTNFSSWYRQDEGTVFADVSVLSTSKANQTLSFNDGTSNNRVELRPVGSASPLQMRTDCVVSGVAKYANQAFSLAGERRIGALAMKANDFRLQSGSSGISPISDALPTVDCLYLNYATFAAGEINGTIRRLVYWPQRLANNVLQTITQ